MLIMGGGVIACETAVYLARKGKQVTLCARQDLEELDMDTVDHNNRFMLLAMIQDAGITVHRGNNPHRGCRRRCGSTRRAQKKLPADSLVFAGRLFPHNDLGELLTTCPILSALATA